MRVPDVTINAIDLTWSLRAQGVFSIERIAIGHERGTIGQRNQVLDLVIMRTSDGRGMDFVCHYSRNVHEPDTIAMLVTKTLAYMLTYVH